MRHARRRSGLFLGALALAVALPPLYSCAADPFSETPDTSEGGSPEATAPDATSDGTPDALDAAPVAVEAGLLDGAIVGDAGMRVDASGCVVCDCDGDGFNDVMKVGCEDAGGPQDCDDTDTRSRPGQGYLVAPPEPPRNGDWNCVNGVEKYYATNVSCAALAYGAGCDKAAGFSDDPACGAVGSYVQCKSQGTPPLNLDGHCIVGGQNLTTKQACK